MSKNIIYVISHKNYVFPSMQEYCPLIVGANNNKVDIKNAKKDNEGDNISDKNPYFCELTGLYWMYKNANCNLIGLTHYRRYFFKNPFSKSLDDIVDEKYVLNKLKTNDIIVPKKKYLIDGDVFNDYNAHHNKKDLEECISIIEKDYPEYMDALNTILKRKYLYSFNMFIANKELIDKYCAWLFDILFKLEKKIDISKYDSYNKRIYGFLSERLFNVWILKNNLRLCEVCVNNIEENILKEKVVNIIKHIALLPIINVFTKLLVKRIRMKGLK